ncbi:MAG: hydrogenase maturation nickel metallochaperone HypA [Acidimicrobiales bacterium]
MHELGLCTSIVDAVEKRAGRRAVAQVRVRVGQLHHVHPEAFGQSFAVAAMGTVAEDATAELVLVPVRARCRACAAAWDCEDVPLACGGCGSVEVDMIGGDELVLEWVRYKARDGERT